VAGKISIISTKSRWDVAKRKKNKKTLSTACRYIGIRKRLGL
jgi:hypothetical protein